MKKNVVFAGVMALLLSSCATTAGVQRIDAGTQTDLSGYWNDTDVKIVCESLINDCLNSPRVADTIAKMGGKPLRVLVGTFKNKSTEHIDTSIISRIMEITIDNSGKMEFVAGGDTRSELRAERQDQQGNASEETAASLANETAADFMLFGTVNAIVDKSGNQTVRSYIVDAEMTNIETNQRIWMGMNSEIKKVVTRAKNKL